MRKGRVVAVAAACLIFLFTAGIHPVPQGWAQDAGVAGAYEVKQYLINNESKDVIVKSMPRLYLLPNRFYIWGTFHAPYRLAGQVIDLDCRWTGEVPSSGRLTFSWTKKELRQEHKVFLEYLGPLPQLAGDQVPQVKACNWEKQAGPVGRQLVAAAQPPDARPMPRVLQAQANPRRAIDGELLLAIRNQGAQPADAQQWACVVNNGYPKVEFAEQGGSPTEVFVWPDARFRTELRGGTPYLWNLLPAGCDLTGRQLGGLLQPGPLAPAPTQEKVVLACYVSGGRFASCQAWWLIKP